MGRPAYPVVSWKANQTASDIVKCDGNQLVGFKTGAVLVSTTMTFSMITTLAVPGATTYTFVPVNGSAGALSFTVAPNQYYGFTADQQSQFLGVEVFKFVGGTAEAIGTTIQPVLIPRQY